MPRLRRADCSRPGLTRRRAGKGFTYLDASGARVTDPEVVARVKALVIPPAWTDVWICPDPMGHIQAVGVDARGRTQYRYHDLWRERRDREKFEHMLEFAQVLSDIRRRCAKHLAEDGLGRERVLACAVRLLDLGFFRIGTEGYAEENQTFGLATMRKDHVRVNGDEVEFDYAAKGGIRRVASFVDPDVVTVVQALKRRRGGSAELFAFKQGRRWVDVKSPEINLFIKELTGGDFTAKDFRTWNATVLASVALAVSHGVARSVTGRKRAVARAMKEVATYLGNTPAVCRSSYVDPRVVDRYRRGVTIIDAMENLDDDIPPGHLATQGSIEAAVLEVLYGMGDVADELDPAA